MGIALVSCALGATCIGAAAVGCTETPDSFPPCVYTAPCPGGDGGDSGEPEAGDAGVDAMNQDGGDGDQ